MFSLLLLFLTAQHVYGDDIEIKGFDDTVFFDVTWPGNELPDTDVESKVEDDYMIITTSFKEKYRCILPDLEEREPDTFDDYDGPTPLDLISPLFSQSSCSYRLESYWTYEVCHGRHIRQYHEDREGKMVKVQEYVLGQWPKNYYEQLLDEMKVTVKETNVTIPKKKIDGVRLPYYQLTMKNGTMCELYKNRPRQTNVLYVCYIHGKHEIFSFKEIATCVYEVIILSPLLCAHPRYKPREISDKLINCTAIENSPAKPRNLIKMKNEAAKIRFKKEIENIRMNYHPLDAKKKQPPKEIEEPPKQPETPIDTSPVESFLAGKNCLSGGTGWWKYEFCYGRYVEQFHIEKGGTKIAINLGRFNKAKHLEWLSTHPHKRPKPQGQRTQLSHLYADGSICDKTGKSRQTEVKLKCLQNASNLNAVSLYLLEPRYCEYILGVESPLICNILARADDDGMVASFDDDGIIEDDISTINIIRV